MADFDHVRALGGSYDISTTIVDRQGSRELGRGMAFETGHAGMANTGLEPIMNFPLKRPMGTKYAKLVQESMDYKKRLRGKFEMNVADHFEMLSRENTVGAIMYKRALSKASHTTGGTLDVSRAFAMRSSLGEDERKNLGKLIQVARSDLHQYNLVILSNTDVTAVDVSDPKRPGIETKSVKHSSLSKHIYADTVRLNTGTTWKHPIRDADVINITFSQPMNRTDIGAFLEKHALLDVDGKLKSGARILSGGASLSTYDQICALEKFMDLFEEDDSAPAGYKVRADAKSKYQNAITLVSRSLGKMAVPRHSHTMEWQQATRTIGDTRQFHALFLHQNGEEVFKSWPVIIKAAIARASARIPCDVDPTVLTIEEMAAMQYRESKKHLWKLDEAAEAERAGDMHRKKELLRESTQTLYGSRRQAELSMMTGYGMEESLEEATAEMSKRAPITWMGRQGLLLHRAQLKSISDARFASEQSNADLFKTSEDYIRGVAASPVEIHSIIAKLVQAGIVKHVTGSYLDITASAIGKGLYLYGSKYDALVVTTVITREADGAARSMQGAVKAVHASRPEFGEVSKFRQVLSTRGEATNVEDYGLTGKGTQITLEDGSHSLVGVFAVDVNTRASVTSECNVGGDAAHGGSAIALPQV